MNVFFAGGGTGGHLYPALAIARAMVAADSRVEPFFIGAKRGIERDVLKTTEFPFELLDLHPLYRRAPWQNWRTLVGGAAGWRRIARVAASSRPCALVATGGYAAGVALGFAAARRIPIVIQEQNSFAGLTVRFFAPRATQIHLGFPEAAATLRVGKATEVFVTGNPIEPPVPPGKRLDPGSAAAHWGFEGPRVPTLLVFGGSQGAEAINRVVADWIWDGGPEALGVRVIWATGPANFSAYSSLDRANVRVRPYISPMRDAYMAADVALTRAGAMTTAELAAWGIPAILVPLPTAAADHQTANAGSLATAGAAVMISQSGFGKSSLAAALGRLLDEPAVLAAMRDRALERGRPQAAHDIAQHILSMRCFK